MRRASKRFHFSLFPMLWHPEGNIGWGTSGKSVVYSNAVLSSSNLPFQALNLPPSSTRFIPPHLLGALVSYWLAKNINSTYLFIDTSNPISWRETRDADIPTVIRHLYYHAGWAQQREVTTNHKKIWKFLRFPVTVSLFLNYLTSNLAL